MCVAVCVQEWGERSTLAADSPINALSRRGASNPCRRRNIRSGPRVDRFQVTASASEPREEMNEQQQGAPGKKERAAANCAFSFFYCVSSGHFFASLKF